MQFDSATFNGDLEPHILPDVGNAVVEEMSANDASEPPATSSALPSIDHGAESRMSADSAVHDKGSGGRVEKQGPAKSSSVSSSKKGREAVAVASPALVTSSCVAPLVCKTDTRVSYSYPELLKRSEDNKLYRAGSAIVFSLGCLTTPSVFHTRRYILPFGFTSVRSFFSYVHPDVQCPYICEILDGGDGKQALFRVTCIDDVEQPVVALSPSAAWRQVTRMIRAQAQHLGIAINMSDQVSGLVMFGVVHPSIQQTLRGLAGSARCKTMDYFEHKTGYEDGADVDIIDASTYSPDPRLLLDDSDEADLRAVVPVNNFLSELDQHVNDIIATTPLSRRASGESFAPQPLPLGLSHDEVAHIISVISSDAELSTAEAEVFDQLVAHVRSTSSHSPEALPLLNNGKHDVLCWWHMHEATCAALGFSRSIELLRKAREELAQHHSQLVQVSHKYDKSVCKNAKLEDSIGATKRELEEFKRKDVENAKAIKQGQFMAREYKRVQRELQEKTDAEAAAEHVIDWRLTTDELAVRRRQVVLLEHNVEFLRSSLERARCDALFHTCAADSHRQAMTSVRLQVASVRSVLMDAIAACDQAGAGIDVRERIGTALSMLEVDTLGERPVFKPHSTTALFVKRLRVDGSIQNCHRSAHSVPMPWKKRVLLHMEPAHREDEPSAANTASSLAVSTSDAVTAEHACESGDIMKDTTSSEQNDVSANDCVPQCSGGARVDFPQEMAPAEGLESMVA